MSMTVHRIPVGVLETNAYLLCNGQRALLIDPGDQPERLLAECRSAGVTVEGILLTHAHFDHMGAVAAVQNATGAWLAVPKDDEPALTDSNLNLSYFGNPVLPLTADRLLAEGDTVTLGDLTVTVWHTPGHTVGSSCYRCRDYLFSGDTLFCGSCGRIDFPGGDGAQMQASLARLAAVDENLQVLPGHGETTTLDRERQTNPYMIGK